MNRGIEMHDSTLAGVDSVGSDVVVRLAPAYVHHSDGRPGVDAGSGWVQDVDLVVREAIVTFLPTRLPCWLSDGTLSIDGVTWENIIPLPLAFAGPVALASVTAEDESLVVHGTGIEVVPRGEPRYVEPFPGTADA